MDAQVKKQVLRKLTYGLYVATAQQGEQAAAATINWLSQASFQPPLVMLAVKADSGLHALLSQGAALAVNILGADQKGLAETFFRPTKLEGNTLSGVPFTPGETGAPLLQGVPAAFEAKVVHSYAGGDHTVFVAEVVAVHLRDPEAKVLEMWDTGWFYGG
ncbi:MAG: flavin reductase family protein [Bacillota bacterium]|nr:MAG: flavin reductase [Bacillota bacterium]